MMGTDSKEASGLWWLARGLINPNPPAALHAVLLSDEGKQRRLPLCLEALLCPPTHPSPSSPFPVPCLCVQGQSINRGDADQNKIPRFRSNSVTNQCFTKQRVVV